MHGLAGKGPIRMDTSADIFTPHCSYIVDIFCMHNIQHLMSSRPCILCAATSAVHTRVEVMSDYVDKFLSHQMFGLPFHSTLCHSNTSSTLDSCFTSVSVACSSVESPYRCSILLIHILDWSAAESKIDEGLHTAVKGWVKHSMKWRHGMSHSIGLYNMVP